MSATFTGKIYKLVNDVNDEVYIGSTKQPLYKRLDGHKHQSKKGKSKISTHIRDIGAGHFKIVLIQEYECKSREELNKYEDEWMRKYDAVENGLNSVQARCKDKWYDENKDRLQSEYVRGLRIKQFELFKPIMSKMEIAEFVERNPDLLD
jgi:hypothetical protein